MTLEKQRSRRIKNVKELSRFVGIDVHAINNKKWMFNSCLWHQMYRHQEPSPTLQPNSLLLSMSSSISRLSENVPNETLKWNKKTARGKLIEMRMNWKDRKMIDFLAVFNFSTLYRRVLISKNFIVCSSRFNFWTHRIKFKFKIPFSSPFSRCLIAPCSFFMYSLWKIKCLIYVVVLCLKNSMFERTREATCHVQRSLIMTITFNHIRNDEWET